MNKQDLNTPNSNSKKNNLLDNSSLYGAAGNTAVSGLDNRPTAKTNKRLIIGNQNLETLRELTKNAGSNMTIADFASQLKQKSVKQETVAKESESDSTPKTQEVDKQQVTEQVSNQETTNEQNQAATTSDSSIEAKNSEDTAIASKQTEDTSIVDTVKETAENKSESTAKTTKSRKTKDIETKSVKETEDKVENLEKEAIADSPKLETNPTEEKTSTEVDLSNLTITESLNLEQENPDLVSKLSSHLQVDSAVPVTSHKDEELSSSSTIFTRTNTPSAPKENPFSLKGSRALDNGQTVIISSNNQVRTNITRSETPHRKTEITPTFMLNGNGNFDPNMSVAELMASGKTLYGDPNDLDEVEKNPPVDSAQAQVEAHKSQSTEAFVATKKDEQTTNTYLDLGSATSDDQNTQLNNSGDALAFSPSTERNLDSSNITTIKGATKDKEELDSHPLNNLKADLKEELDTKLNLNLSAKEKETVSSFSSEQIQQRTKTQTTTTQFSGNYGYSHNFDKANQQKAHYQESTSELSGIAGEVPDSYKQQFAQSNLTQTIDNEQNNNASMDNQTVEEESIYSVGPKNTHAPFYRSKILYTSSFGEPSPYVCGVNARQLSPEEIAAINNQNQPNMALEQPEAFNNPSAPMMKAQENMMPNQGINGYEQNQQLKQPPVEEDDGPRYPGVYADVLAENKKEALRRQQEQQYLATNSNLEQNHMPQEALMQAQMLNQIPEQNQTEINQQVNPLEQNINNIDPNAEYENHTSAGMEDGILAQEESLNTASSAVRANNEPEDNGPHYLVGHKSPYENQLPEEEDDGPVYAVGPSSKNASVIAKVQAERDRMQMQRRMPFMNAQELEYAYEQSLAQAARESHAAPQSEVVRRARELAKMSYESQDKQQNLNAENYDNFNNYYETNKQVNNLDSNVMNQEVAQNLAQIESELPQNEQADIDQETDAPNDNEIAQALQNKREEQLKNQRKEKEGKYNFANMPNRENIGFGISIFLYIRQLVASFFSHTTLSTLAPKTAMRLGPCYPSSMAIPFFFIGLISGLLGSSFHSIEKFDFGSGLAYLSYVLMTGLASFRGIYRMCAYINRRRHDVFLMVASLTIPLLILIWLMINFISSTNSIAEATITMACSTMLSAALASTLSWNMPQDPIDSCGTMSTKGLLFVMVLCGALTFGLLNEIVALSIFGVSIVIRCIFGYLFNNNHATMRRTYINALQLLILFAILFDLILLKNQNYGLLSNTAIELNMVFQQLF